MGSKAHPHHVHVPRSEAFSFWSHALGAVVGVVAAVVLVGRAEDLVARVAFSVYGGSLVLLFTSSALHHLPVATVQEKSPTSAFRRLDHAAIFVFIAGTYTPICLLSVPPAVGLPMLATVWALALAGVVLKVVRPTAPRWTTVSLYIGLGWLAALSPRTLFAALPPMGTTLLVAGGLTYTAGAIMYAMKKPDPFPRVVGFHGIWHVFVLVAAALHYVVILAFIPASAGS